MSLTLVASAIQGDFKEQWEVAFKDVREAAQAAIVSAATTVKSQGRADIASAGFSKLWENALRVDVYPKRGASVNAAAFIYHKIAYAGVFEEGATISGKPTLWLPLRTTPKKIGTRRLTPETFTEQIGKLQLIKGSKPLLAAKMATNGPNDRDVTLNKIRQAYGRSTFRQGGKRRLAGGRIAKDGFSVRSVPLFHGVSAVKIPKKFSIYDICDDAAAKLADLYVKNFKGGE